MPFSCLGWYVPICYLNKFYKIQKLISRAVGPILAAPLEILANRSLAVFFIADMVPLPYALVRSTQNSKSYMTFLSFLLCYKDSYVTI